MFGNSFVLNPGIKNSEKDLIEGIRAGRDEAITCFFNEYGPRLIAICNRYAPDMEEAKDIFQEGFLKIINVIGSFRNEAKFESWLHRIMVNHCINSIRKSKKGIHWVELSDNLLNQPEESFETEDIVLRTSQILEHMSKLPNGYRLVLNMYAVDGRTHKEIAKELSISESTSKTQLFKARRALLVLIKMNSK